MQWNDGIHKICVRQCLRIAKNILYISQIINFNEEHSNMPIYKTLEKSWILNILRKESIFSILKEKFFFRRIGVFTSLGVGNLTWPCTDISKKGNNLRKWWLNLFSFSLHGSNVKIEKNVTSNFQFTFVNDY